MKATSLFFSVLLSLFILSHLALGQGKKQPATCPIIKVTAPDTAEAGKQVIFTVNVADGDAQVKPTYNWAVSAGAISTGQGTSVIKVNLKEVSGDVTATVEVGGYSPDCPSVKSSTVMVLQVEARKEARKMGKYGKTLTKEEQKQLGNFVTELMTDPEAMGYIFVYGGRKERATETQKAAKKIKTEMVKTAGLPADRLILINSGSREKFAVELWLIPTGAMPPQPTPSVPDGIKSSGAKKTTKSKSSTRRKR